MLILLLGVSLVLLVGLNLPTQPIEESLSAFPRGQAYYLDYAWYLDDVIGPALFMATGLLLLLRMVFVERSVREMWPVALLGLVLIGFALGDSFDVHWVFTAKAEASDEMKSFGSFGSKLLTLLALGFSVIYSFRFFTRRAGRAALFVLLLMLVDLVMLSVSLEFAGYTFHILEESVEVLAGLFLVLGVAREPLGEEAASQA